MKYEFCRLFVNTLFCYCPLQRTGYQVGGAMSGSGSTLIATYWHLRRKVTENQRPKF